MTLCVMVSRAPSVLYVSWTILICCPRRHPNFVQCTRVPITESCRMQQGKGSLERQPDQEVGGQALNPPIYEYNIGTGEIKTEVNYSMGDKKTERVMM